MGRRERSFFVGLGSECLIDGPFFPALLPFPPISSLLNYAPGYPQLAEESPAAEVERAGIRGIPASEAATGVKSSQNFSHSVRPKFRIHDLIETPGAGIGESFIPAPGFSGRDIQGIGPYL
jgi:hypothetical protein